MASTDASETPSARRRLGVGAAVVVVIVALTVTVGIGVVRGAIAPVERVPVNPGATPGTTSGAVVEQAGVYAHISGAVATPGLYVLPQNARVVDAVAAAGGFTADAHQASVNLARILADGEQLHVPTQDEVQSASAQTAPGGTAPGGTAPGGTAPGDGRVNLNTAGIAELDTLPRIGESMAQRILDWREDNGRFTSVEDLLAVPGIGDKMLEALRELVTV